MGNKNNVPKPVPKLDLEELLQQFGALTSQVRPPLQSQSLPGGEFQTKCFVPQIMENQSYTFNHFVSFPEGMNHMISKKIKKELRSLIAVSNKFPNSAHGVVKGTNSAGQFSTGTGVLIGFDLVLTAAHNIMEIDGHLLRDLVFIPGVSGEFTPFGVLKVLDTYFPDERQEDYALLVLDKTIGEKTGFFGLHVANKKTLKEINEKEYFSLYGYPGYVGKNKDNDNTDGIIWLASKGNHQQWGMKGKVDHFTPYDDGEYSMVSMVSYSNNELMTTPGQSGSGLCYERDGNYYVVGIHVMGDECHNDEDEIFNHSIIINKTRFSKIQEWVGKSRIKLLQKVLSTTELDLSSKKIDTNGSDLLVKFSQSSPLTKLSLRNCDFAANVKNFKKSQFTELTELNLSENNLGDIGAEILAGNKYWKKLFLLNLESNSIGDDGAMGLSNNKSWENLESLKIGRNNIGDTGVSAIAKNQTWSNLKFLELQMNKIGNKGALSLGRNESWPELVHLNISHNSIGDQGILALAKNTTWIKLTVLKMRNNPLEKQSYASKNPTWTKLSEFLEFEKFGDEFKEKLRRSDFLHTRDACCIEMDFSSKALDIVSLNILLRYKLRLLSFLNLANNQLGDSGAEIVASNRSWVNLRKICLSSNQLQSRGVVALRLNESWKHLEELDLGYNIIGDDGASELSKASSWTNLKVLRIPQNLIRDSGAEKLSKNSTWPELQSLYLLGNSIGHNGAAFLGMNKDWMNLSCLDIRNNAIKDQGLKGLSQNGTWKNLRKLFLCGNEISDGGLMALCQNKVWIHLQALRISNNKIGKKGVAILAQNSQWVGLEELELGKTSIEDDGAKILSGCAWKNLKVLGLNQNDISASGALDLSKNQSWENLEVLHLESNKLGEKAVLALRKNRFWPKLRELNVDLQ